MQNNRDFDKVMIPFIYFTLQVKFALLDERDIDLINQYAFEVRNACICSLQNLLWSMKISCSRFTENDKFPTLNQYAIDKKGIHVVNV